MEKIGGDAEATKAVEVKPPSLLARMGIFYRDDVKAKRDLALSGGK
jgi:hypothetical protein